jgi:hypothetical protein
MKSIVDNFISHLQKNFDIFYADLKAEIVKGLTEESVNNLSEKLSELGFNTKKEAELRTRLFELYSQYRKDNSENKISSSGY